MNTTLRGQDAGRQRPGGRGGGRRTPGHGGQRRGRRPAGRPTRGQQLRRRWVAVLVLLSIVGLVYSVLFTSLAGVRSVEVSGTTVLTPDEVRAAAKVVQGSPMVRLDSEGIRARVAALPRVAAVEVRRSFPSTVRLMVTERTPVAVFKTVDGPRLVDGTGFAYASAVVPPNPADPTAGVPDPSAGLPELLLGRVAPDDPATRSAVTVLAAIPRAVRPSVLSITVRSPSDVRLVLSGGRDVRWGSAEDSRRKGAVLVPLLTREGKSYDVSSPELPTVS